ncbi:hypothetical protein BU17DRAFT_71973 [Hysterangium stoloniferum]|nr:hypothetical protein BU17DRAFT_71973 [Hysterangium stoloniferum]
MDNTSSSIHPEPMVVTADPFLRFAYTAAIVVMMYDYGKILLQLCWELIDDPFRSIWQRRWSLGKCLYLFCGFVVGSYKPRSDLVRYLSVGHNIWWDIFSLVYIDEEKYTG